MRLTEIRLTVFSEKFQSTHPVWDATLTATVMPSGALFQSTHPVWDATCRCGRTAQPSIDFNPRIPYGMRPLGRRGRRSRAYFNPRIPYGMRQTARAPSGTRHNISIHASRMGCDQTVKRRDTRPIYFNPRIPYGMRQNTTCSLHVRNAFQSTHPVWDATVRPQVPASCRAISIHASRMGCDLVPWVPSDCVRAISIHASRMGCDTTGLTVTYGYTEFQSTHPVWDATSHSTHWK